MEPEQWLQRHPEAGSSWPNWPEASHPRPCTHRATKAFSSFEDPNVRCRIIGTPLCAYGVLHRWPYELFIYRGTSLTRKRTPCGWVFSYGQGTPVRVIGEIHMNPAVCGAPGLLARTVLPASVISLTRTLSLSVSRSRPFDLDLDLARS